MNETRRRTTKSNAIPEASSSKRGLFLLPLLGLLDAEVSRAPEGRRGMFAETPPWLLLFSGCYRQKAQNFLHLSVCTMVALETLPTYPSFHMETGILSKHLVEYLRSVDPEKAGRFASAFRSYLTGERKRMPRNVSPDAEAYEKLRRVVRTDYTRRLIGEWKGGTSYSRRTQDFVVLFEMPLSALVETVLGSMTEEDVVEAIEQYRA